MSWISKVSKRKKMKKLLIISAFVLLNGCSVSTPQAPETDTDFFYTDKNVEEFEFQHQGLKPVGFELDNYVSSYPHGIFGIDELPTVIRFNNKSFDVSPDVIEGMPITGDINEDGIDDFILTVSNKNEGARIIALDNELKLIAESDPIGTGFRWRHTIAVEKLGASSETELVSIRTPHIGGVVEYFRILDEKLVVVAQKKGFSSHIIGSDNLEMALVADFNKDGKDELIVPTQDMTEIVGLQRSLKGIEEIYRLQLDGELTTKIIFTNGKLIAGTKDKARVWEAK